MDDAAHIDWAGRREPALVVLVPSIAAHALQDAPPAKKIKIEKGPEVKLELEA